MDTDKVLLVVQAARHDIVAENVMPALEQLLPLLLPDAIHRFADKVDFRICGYDDEKRNLFEIPEIRRWMWKLDAAFPFWLYFLVPEKSAMNFVVFSLLDPVKTADGRFRLRPDDLASFLTRRFHAVNFLEGAGWITPEENRDVTRKVERHFIGLPGNLF